MCCNELCIILRVSDRIYIIHYFEGYRYIHKEISESEWNNAKEHNYLNLASFD